MTSPSQMDLTGVKLTSQDSKGIEQFAITKTHHKALLCGRKSIVLNGS